MLAPRNPHLSTFCRLFGRGVSTMAASKPNGAMSTRIMKVEQSDLGHWENSGHKLAVQTWVLPKSQSPNLKILEEAGRYLKTSIIPVAFPTETVYGLGADATRRDAVKGIYKAKGRPSDNPLIIHVCDLDMLQGLLLSDQLNGYHDDLIPSIYKPLIEKFWPGPLTILLPVPERSKLAPEVTAGLKTFGVRIPNSPLALSLIKLAEVPIAAPSANASTKPSPTTAEHVLNDLSGKIELILDGGACDVGVESTVVDGLCSPPVILRPGGLSINDIRGCRGWEGVVKGYKDKSELGNAAPRAPGMKYKHYSPKAKVVLFEKGVRPSQALIPDYLDQGRSEEGARIGIIRTKGWPAWAGWDVTGSSVLPADASILDGEVLHVQYGELRIPDRSDARAVELQEVDLGSDTKAIAHGLFSALRELDKRNVDVILVEGIEDDADIAAAVMNRLRKAAVELHSGSE